MLHQCDGKLRLREAFLSLWLIIYASVYAKVIHGTTIDPSIQIQRWLWMVARINAAIQFTLWHAVIVSCYLFFVY